MGAMSTVDRVSRLRHWCQLVLPAVFDDSLSYYELLCKVVAKLNEVIDGNNELAGIVADNAEDIKQLKQDLNVLKNTYEDFLAGKVPQSYIEGIATWLDQNLQCAVNRTVKFFSFGIDEDGHVYVDMPCTWRWLEFSWNMLYGSDTFGRIELNW